MGVFFCKKVENSFFVKSGPFLNAGCIMYSISIFYFTFYLFGCVYAPYVKLYRPTGLYSLNFKVRDALQIQDRSREHVLRFLGTGPNLRRVKSNLANTKTWLITGKTFIRHFAYMLHR